MSDTPVSDQDILAEAEPLPMTNTVAAGCNPCTNNIINPGMIYCQGGTLTIVAPPTADAVWAYDAQTNQYYWSTIAGLAAKVGKAMAQAKDKSPE